MMNLRFLPFVFLAAALTACAPTATRVVPVQPPPQPEAAKPSQPPEHKKAGKEIQETGKGAAQGEKPARPAAPPAVLALMKEADINAASGSYDNAASSLERAIRIQPRSALLWQKLAEVRLQQHQPGLAEDLAKKSNVLAKGNKDLIHKNWVIIADARRQKGDAEGAADAEAKAGR